MEFYTKRKRDEMTFGFPVDNIPADLVPDPNGSTKMYSLVEMYEIGLLMDKYFTGMRRSTIDTLRNIRQAILYTMITKALESGRVFAVYSRSGGSDARLKGSWSIGFGGHVEVEDLAHHYDVFSDEVANGSISSFESILASGRRELFEEVNLLLKGKDGESAPLYGSAQEPPIFPIGYLSDLNVDTPDHVGNTHLCMLGFVDVPPEVEIEMGEDTQTFIGWMTTDELRDNLDQFEPWSRLVIADMADITRAMNEGEAVQAVFKDDVYTPAYEGEVIGLGTEKPQVE